LDKTDSPLIDQSIREERRAAPRREDDRRRVRKDRELQAARLISEALFEHLTPDELVAKALRTALDVVQAESGSILLADPASQQLIFRHSIGESPVKAGTAIPWDKGIAGTVFQSGDPLVVRDAKQDPRHISAVDELTSHTTHDMIAIPLKRWEGEPIGVLEVLNKRGGLLDEDDVAILSIVSAITASSIEQARLYHEAKLAEVVRLLGDISHDIKNLLMPVVVGAELMEDELKILLGTALSRGDTQAQESFERCNEVVGMVDNSLRRIQDRVKEIADCVKGLSSPPEFAPCQLDKVIREVTDTLKWWSDQKGVSIRTSGLGQTPAIVADERRLFNALYNLINNAIPEVPAGGTITVSTKEEPIGVGLLISIADTGNGMPPEIRDTLFTPAARSTKPGGTGLGTKIVKDVVDAHRGRITVESELGVGTTFHLCLPLRPPGTSPTQA
jgi:signal transduction histidine kinase